MEQNLCFLLNFFSWFTFDLAFILQINKDLNCDEGQLKAKDMLANLHLTCLTVPKNPYLLAAHLETL